MQPTRSRSPGSAVERLDPKPLCGDRTHRLRLLAAFALTLTFTLTASAQFEIKGGAFNTLYRGTVPNAANNTPPIQPNQPQFKGQAITGGGHQAISAIPLAPPTVLYPSQIYVVAGTSTPTGAAIVHVRASFGFGFVTGAPRYLFGDFILPPNRDDAGAELAADSTYWRAEPVKPGETFVHVDGPQDSGPHIAANTTLNYYFSPHAERVLASQFGRVAITWVSRVPVASGADNRRRYRFRDETFAVSAAAAKPTRTIFWTEKSFNGPIVNVPIGNIEAVNPIYHALFPAAVAEEFKPVGVSTPTDPNAAAPAEKRTVWFEKPSGIGQLHAYNVEGRLLVEYLGKQKPGANSSYTFLGADILEVVRSAPTVNVTVELGQKLTPRDSDNRRLPLDSSSEWLASPVISHSPDGQSFYGTNARNDGVVEYYAERENPNPDRVTFYWLEKSDAAIPSGAATPTLNLFWPKAKNAYVQIWPTALASYAHPTVGPTGSTSATGIQFAVGQLPQVIFQDDSTQTESALDTTSQRFVTTFSGGDGLNRSLLKFTSGNEVWYVPLYTQADGRSGFQESDGAATPLTGTATVGQRLAPPSADYATAGHLALSAGSSDAYDPSAYLDPHAVGVEQAAKGAIIPVNAIPGKTELKVWWFKSVSPPSAAFKPFYVPAKVGRYTVSYPASPREIVLASNLGSDDLSPSEAAGQLYIQNDRAAAGFNPNEEHALLLNSRVYALRDDLNDLSANGVVYTSEPFVLLKYTSPTDLRPAMSVFKVVRETASVKFDYAITAGTVVQPPMPLPILSLPLDAAGKSKNLEVPGVADHAHQGPSSYTSFTFEDRKGSNWVYRGPHGGIARISVSTGGSGYTSNPTVTISGGGGTGATATATRTGQVLTAITVTNPGSGYTSPPTISFTGGGGGTGATAVAVSPSFGMQFYYKMREGFFVPGLATQPAVGTILPYLRPIVSSAYVGDPVTGTSQTITYRPVWPSGAPSLRIAETLTLPKFGLPDVISQTSAQVFYQQSIATGGSTKPSVVLHDPIREKVFALGGAGQLAALPSSVLTTSSGGKTYFQRLAPHLQSRCYYDPLRGPKGSLILLGKFVDEIAGEDYLQLDVLSPADRTALEGLAGTNDVDRTLWLTAIANLATSVETFIEDPAKVGSFKSDGAPVTVGPTALSVIGNSDTAVVDYALTATGSGSGWITMVFGNGRAFTPTGEPVSVKVFKVSPQLYVGDLKVLPSKNPLDEQVSLRHSADFAGDPTNYEFEWRHAPPLESGSAPAIYDYTQTSRLGTSWQLVPSPAGALPTTAEYTAAQTISLPRSVQILAPGSAAGTGLPGLVVRSTAGVDFTAGVPAQIVFSAAIADLTGFVLYVNGVPSLAFQAPAPFTSTIATSGLASGGLTRQFLVDGGFFQKGVNQVEVAVFSTADIGVSSAIDFRLHASTEVDRVVAVGTPWETPNGTLTNEIVVGGSPSNPLATPLLVMSDNYFTMRYRPKASANNVAGTGWSRWMPPKLVEGWIKRVLAGINPFNQRIGDLYNNAVNTDVSILTQAGKRWEGDIALSLENINDFGLIEIYETVLNRGKNMSIDSGFNYGAANNALLLAAGYLSDLYTILGNEAYADAANPTISVDDATNATEVSTARFAFEGQAANSLEEELALLRGRDDSLTRVDVSPAYNRLYWNYTRGIASGEAIYAVNYNIREKAGSATANGTLDAADAQAMFPQGHGDAYGHYLTALTNYYKLLTNSNFTWTPRPETVTVLGQAVTVDYFDERKFADAASNLARTAQQILTLTHRQSYQDNPAAGWSHFRDSKATRHWGLDEWSSRAGQGSYYHWIVANALLPDKDTDPNHTGVQIIDRTTVASLRELPAANETMQSTVDSANAHLNPLGLSPGAIAFDISPADLKTGKSHYEQVHERALRAVLNAKGAFDQAGKMTRLLRTQENQLGDNNTSIVDQERAFNRQLIELFGTPYSGSIGAGKTYAQGYTGPDTEEFFVIDRPTDLVNTAVPVTVQIRAATGITNFTQFSFEGIRESYDGTTALTANRAVTVQLNQMVQFADVWRGSAASLGARSFTGALQQAMLDNHQASVALLGSIDALRVKEQHFLRRYALYAELLRTEEAAATAQDEAALKIAALKAAQAALRNAERVGTVAADFASQAADAFATFQPTVTGLANDVSSAARGSLKLAGALTKLVKSNFGAILEKAADQIDLAVDDIQGKVDATVEELGFTYQQAQIAYEYELLYREMMHEYLEVELRATDLQRTNERVRSVLTTGIGLLEDRAIFRQRAAAIIQGYRTKDVTFRTFRNEALEQYRSLFDLASRYTYLAAKSYDYETGLLGSTAGQNVINSIVAARALGDLTGGTPQATVSTTGDSGLAGTMARLQADWSVAKGRLGINNPDTNGTVFSLRRELFRILDASSEDTAWQQTVEQHMLSNILADPDVAAACRNLRKADGSAVPGIVIPFSTTVQKGLNFFGLPLAVGDHNFSVSNYATKIYSVGLVLRGYVGMDAYATGTLNAAGPNTTAANGLSATPYVYLIPTGTDYMLAPPLGDTGAVRAFNVNDQALPLPFNLGATAFSTTQFYNANGTLSEQPWIVRKHQAFRPVSDPAFFYGTMPAEFTNARLVGRSVWNSGWKIVIPAFSLLNNEQEGLNRFAASVKDIELFLRTYSHSGN